MSHIVDGWQKVLLRDLCEIVQYGYTASASTEAVGPKFLRITDIVPALIDWPSVPYCSINEDEIDKYLLRDGDIVIARTGATTGYAKRLKNPTKAIFASYLVRLRIKEGVNNRFIGAVVESDKYKKFIISKNTGAAQPNANAQILTSFPITLPPLPTQHKIASILSAYDDLIENNTRRIKILEEMAQTIYREWFVNFRFPGHQKVKKVNSPLGKIPEGWEIRHLSELVETQYGYTETAQEARIGPKFLRGTDINKNPYVNWAAVPYCSISKEEYPKFKLNIEDIVVIRMADPGKVAIVEVDIDAVFASYLVRLTISNKSITPYYLFHFLLSDTYQGYISGASTGTTRKSASAGVIVGIDILAPPKPILEKFQSVVVPLRKMLNNLLAKNAVLRQTRDLLLPKLISGELDVSELDITIPEANA